MRALHGKRAMVAGSDGAYADVVAARLRREGAATAESAQEIPQLAETDIVVICPPHAAFAPGTSAAVLTETILHARRWTEAAAAAMTVRGSGTIVHVTGLPGLGGWRGWHSSGAAFAAIHGLVKSFALELAPHGVRINALVTGVTLELAETIAGHAGLSEDAVRVRIPAGRYLTDDDIGNALVYLVHDSASYITGETLVIDGGWDTWGRLHAAAAT